MAQHSRLGTVLRTFLRSLQDCERLAAEAYLGTLPGTVKRPPISRRRRDLIVELAFLSAFLAWETFLEESFLLYVLGQKPPRGRAPQRYAFPPSQRAAMDWLSDGRPYARWVEPSEVRARAERFFRSGQPFARVLRSNQNLLQETNTIRNAIAHRSQSARDKFESIVREKLKILPPGLTVGSFLGTAVPGSSPPSSFLEFYISRVELAAQQIVPSV